MNWLKIVEFDQPSGLIQTHRLEATFLDGQQSDRPVNRLLQFRSPGMNLMPSTPDAFQTPAMILGSFILLLWILEAVDQLLLQNRLNRLGIRPRHQQGLRGILFAPLLHGTWGHLSANTVPLLVLGWLVMLGGIREFAIATITTWLISGLGVWLFGGSNTLHIGASGLVFGYFGFLLSRSYFEYNPVSAGVAVLVALIYGPLIWGVFPFRRGISWQGHLFGFIGGVLAARYLPELQQWFTKLETLWRSVT